MKVENIRGQILSHRVYEKQWSQMIYVKERYENKASKKVYGEKCRFEDSMEIVYE